MTTFLSDPFGWVQAVEACDLPPQIKLDDASTVTDPALWLSKIKQDALDGATAPRAKYGALQRDLKIIHDYVITNTQF